MVSKVVDKTIMKNASSLKSNYIYNLLYQIVNIMMPLILTPYLSRSIGAYGMGRYSYVYSISYFFMIFIKQGFLYYGNRTIAETRQDKETLSNRFCEMYVLQLIYGAFSICMFILLYLSGIIKEPLLILMVFLLVGAAIDVTWFFQGMEEFKLVVARDIGIKIISAMLIFSFVKETNDVWIYILIRSADVMLGQLIVFPLVAKYIDIKYPKLENIQRHIKPNLILFIPTIAVGMFNNIDNIMLGFSSNEIELGLYHNSHNIIMVPIAFVTALGTVMMPRISNKLSLKDNAEIEPLMKKSFYLTAFCSTSMCFGIMSVAKEFVPVYYGEAFYKCVNLYYIMLPSSVFIAFANVIRTQYLMPHHMEKKYIYSLFVGVVINFIINACLIPYYGSIGAAIGTLVAEMTVCVMQAIYVHNELDIKEYIKIYVPFLFAGIIMFAFGYLVKLSAISELVIRLIVKILLCGSLYLIVIRLFYKKRWNDLAIYDFPKRKKDKT